MIDELLKALKAEEVDASSFHNSELATAQADALKRFYARKQGDEVEGRSQVVSSDLRDTVLSIMPDLMRLLRQQDELVTVKPTSPEDDAPGEHGKSLVDVQAAYLCHVFFEDNPGLTIAYDFMFDGLVQRLGVIRAAHQPPDPKPPKLLEGVTGESLVKYMTDPEYSVLEQEETAPGVFTMLVQHVPRGKRTHIEAVPPEEFAIARGSKDIASSRYHRRKRKVYLVDLIRQFPQHKAALLERKGEKSLELTDDGRLAERHSDTRTGSWQTGDDEGRVEVELCEEFIRYNYDGDDYVELRQVKRVGDVILENEAVEHSEFVAWTPTRISHKVDGLSIDDLIGELQKIRTAITRALLDGLGETVSPRTYVKSSALDGNYNTLGILQANRRSSLVVVDTQGPISEAVQERMAPDVSAPALTSLEFFDRRIQESSGVTRQSQGMDPEAMNKTATGIDLLQAAAKTRIEMIATWLGAALEDVFKLILKTLVAHQDQARQVKLFGQWMPVDPRRWNDEAGVSVHVGTAGVSRHQRLANLALIAQKQEQVLMTAGPQNPLVTLQHLRGTYAEMVGAMGFKDTGRFFGEIPEGWQPPEPGPDPKVAAEQAKMQLEQAKAQQTAQIEAQRMQFDQQKASAEFQHKTRLAEMDLQMRREIEAMKLQSERELALMKIQAEQTLARERMNAEMAMAKERADREHALAVKRSDDDKEVKMNGFRPGGKLDA